jgi:hypothetical protein
MSSDEASSSCGNASPGSTQGVRHWFHCAATRVALTCCLLQKSDRAPGTVSSREWRFHHCAMRSGLETNPCLPSNPSSERTQPSCGRPPLALPRSLHLQPPPSHPPRAQADVGAANRQRAGPHAHARMHARTLDHACSMPVGLTQPARCPACGCNGRTQVPPTRACRARCEATVERPPRRFG